MVFDKKILQLSEYLFFYVEIVCFFPLKNDFF